MANINTALLNDFIDESREHLDEMESLLLQLGADLSNLDILNDIFRTMHNVKGTSQLTGLDRISRLSHRLEDLLDLLRRGEKETTLDIVDMMISGRDRIVVLVDELEESQQELSTVDELINLLNILLEGDAADTLETEPAISSSAPLQEKISTDPTFTGSSVTNPVLATSTEYDEKNDEELFNIFSDHLKEQFSLLCIASLQFKQDSVNDEHLLECSDAVQRIKSSVNYMGYDEVLDFLDDWSEKLDDAQESLFRGEGVPAELIDENIDYMISTFPQLEEVRQAYIEDLEDSTEQNNDISTAVMDIFNQEETVEEGSEINLALLDNFINESSENLDEMSALLLQLDDGIGNIDLLNRIFRIIHNIQGAAQLTGLAQLSLLTQRIEDLLDLLRSGQVLLDKSIVELLYAGFYQITLMINELQESQQEVSPAEELVAELVFLIDRTSSMAQEATDTEETLKQTLSSTPSQMDLDDENDHELFSIFIEHLQEQYTELTTCYAGLMGVSDEEEKLVDCLDIINRLYSSANYMGYIELAHFYEEWSDALAKATLNIVQGEEPSLDFMNAYLETLTRAFPQLKNTRATPAISKQTQQTEQTETIIEKANTVNSAISILPHKNQDDSSSKALADGLRIRLSNSLDSSLQTVSSSEYDTLNEVFDVLVSSESEKAPMTAKEEDPAVIKQQKQESNTADETAARPRETSKKKLRKSVRIDADKIDTLMNQVGELVVDRSYFFQLFNEMRDIQQHFKDTVGVDQKEVKLIRSFSYRLGEAIAALGRTSNELQEGVMKMRMLPVSHLFNRYPRLVHDLTSNIDKEVNLILRGEETELDRMIVEEISDPLIHIIRNAIDHGIENIEERTANDKSEKGQLILEAYQESNHIVIQVTDDGRGLNPDKIKQKAVSKGLYSDEEIERLSDREVLNLILMPGFSTADKITATSGRGVGMDVVKRNIETLNGTLDIDSRLGKGTQIRLKIPLTLAIIHALMIRVGKDIMTIPLTNVDETLRISDEDTSMVEGVEVIYLRGVALPVFRLSKLFKVTSDNDSDKSFVVIVNTDGQRIGFMVDELLGQEEVVIKPLEDYVQEKSGFSGATIVGDGRISLIIDVYELVKMTSDLQIRRNREQAGIMKLANSTLSSSSGEMSDRLH